MMHEIGLQIWKKNPKMSIVPATNTAVFVAGTISGEAGKY